MNKNVKRLSVFLAALMMSSAFAASASAIDTSFIKVKNTGAEVIDETPAAAAEAVVETPANDTAVLKTSGWVKTEAGILDGTESGSVFKASDYYVKKAADVVKKTEKNQKVLYIPGGKYYTKKDAEKELEKIDIRDEVSEEVCEQCGKPMLIKYGPHGRFLACSGFPDCRSTMPYFEKTGVECPQCGKDIVLKKSKKGIDKTETI